MNRLINGGAMVLIALSILGGVLVVTRNAQKPQPRSIITAAEPGEESMMVYVIGVNEEWARVVGCPAGPTAGPSLYDISDPGFVAGHRQGDFAPVFYAKTEIPGEYTFTGWMEKQEPE